MKTISIPVNDRPHLLAKCLASIRACPTWREWRIVFSCEPPVREATEQQLVTTPNAHVSRNSTKLGCWSNTFLACEIAYSLGSEFNLYLEDDLEISPDTLTLCDQFSARFPESFLLLRRPFVTEDHTKPNIVKRTHGGLFGDGFAYERNMWEFTRKQWFSYTSPVHKMWDWCLENGLKDTPQYRPFIPRAQNIGFYGTHAAGGTDPNRHSPCYSGPPVTQFTFTP